MDCLLTPFINTYPINADSIRRWTRLYSIIKKFYVSNQIATANGSSTGFLSFTHSQLPTHFFYYQNTNFNEASTNFIDIDLN